MGSDDKKIEVILLGHEVALLLGALASGLRQTNLPEALREFAPGIESCAKFEISVKRHGGMAEVWLKVKSGPGPEAPADGRPRAETYKTVKKRLKTSFKFLRHSLDSQMPLREETVDAFLKDSLAMCAHPGRGEHNYGAHLELCNELKTAFDSDNWGAVEVLLQELEAGMKACHAKAK